MRYPRCGGGIRDVVGRAARVGVVARGIASRRGYGEGTARGGSLVGRGLYHSRWRAVAARGTRQFTADRRAGGFVVLPVWRSSRDTRSCWSARLVPRARDCS